VYHVLSDVVTVYMINMVMMYMCVYLRACCVCKCVCVCKHVCVCVSACLLCVCVCVCVYACVCVCICVLVVCVNIINNLFIMLVFLRDVFKCQRCLKRTLYCRTCKEMVIITYYLYIIISNMNSNIMHMRCVYSFHYYTGILIILIIIVRNNRPAVIIHGMMRCALCVMVCMNVYAFAAS